MKDEIYAALRETQDKFREAGFKTRIVTLGGDGGRLTVTDKDNDWDLIYLDGNPPNDWGNHPFETHVLRAALHHKPEQLQEVLDVLYGEGVFTITKDMELYLYGGRLEVYIGEDICIKVSYPLGNVWTVNGEDQPVMEVTVEYLVCKCCENPDEPTVQCTECPVDVCMDCMEHTHHKAMILQWIDADHYGMDGEHITFCRWASLFEDGNQNGNRIIGKTYIGNRWWVSTVWLGLDHSFGHGPPLIFETMVFRPGEWGGHECIRHATLKEAQEAHEATVRRWRWKLPYFVFAHEFLERKVIWKIEAWWRKLRAQ